MRAAIGLGTSLGDRRARLELTVRRIHRWPGVEVIACSRWYRTPPMRGGAARNPFLNGVVLLETECDADELLSLCQREERIAGRRRGATWGDRTLDLDLLLVGDQLIDTPQLTLPHPGVANRSFVRAPLLDVWPEAAHPLHHRPIASLPPASLPRAWHVGLGARALYPPGPTNLG